MSNEGLVKFAEEYNLGLALHEPLDATQKSRKNTGGAVRRDAFNVLLKELDEDQAGAAYKIAIGWRVREAPVQLKSASRMWWGIPGKGVQEATDKLLEIQEEFNKWWNQMTIQKMIDKRSIAIDVCALGKNFTETAWSHNLSDKTVKKYAIDALDEFVDINRKKQEMRPVVQKVRRPPVIKPSRIIIFED